MTTLKELRDERIKKLEKLKILGIQPFPNLAQKDYPNGEIISNYAKYENQSVNITGRIMSLREHSQLVFMDLYDFSGKIQLYIKQAEIEPTNKENQNLGFDDLNLLDIGDFVQVYGTVTKTKTGEISLLVKKLKLLTKSLRPLPDKHDGLKDPELIFRKRYLDLTINPERKELFLRKSKFWEKTREFLRNKGFIEVETPVLEHYTGGADAKPFATHHDALDEDFYLRISTELYQKRLIGGGFEKVFTLGPDFRNEGLSDEHLQEFYQVEWYWAYANYLDNMNLVKELFKYVAQEVYGRSVFEKNGLKFDLNSEWAEIDYAKIIHEKYNIDVFESTESEILKILHDKKVSLPGTVNRTRLIDNLWKLLRKEISGPAFLIKQPKFISPLAKSIPGNENYTERFQVIIAGSELGNGYTELNDPFDQLNRFVEQQKARDEGDEEAQMLDLDYIEMLEYGMPPTSGYGHSERVFWFLEGLTGREATLFPQMRKKIDETTKEIYGFENSKLVSKSNNMKNKANEKTKSKSAIEHTSSHENIPISDQTSSHSSMKQLKMDFSRDTAHKLLDQNVQDEYQKLHAFMVAAALEAYAQKINEDTNLWYITGLLHDLDYYNFPDEHPFEELKWYKEWDYPQEFIDAINSHAHQRTGVEPNNQLGAALLAIDELAGFLYAYSLMRPEGFEGMESSSVKKKFKDKAFARKVDRDDITYGIEKFKVDFNEHINFLIEIFQKLKRLKQI